MDTYGMGTGDKPENSEVMAGADCSLHVSRVNTAGYAATSRSYRILAGRRVKALLLSFGAHQKYVPRCTFINAGKETETKVAKALNGRQFPLTS